MRKRKDAGWRLFGWEWQKRALFSPPVQIALMIFE
jgi:hypothetical protein